MIPGRAQVTVRVPESTDPNAYRIGIRAGQWNVGLKGAPPPEPGAPVPGDPTLYAAEIWFMTADAYHFDPAFLSRCATRIINEVKGINRVVYDYTSKPPGTIEWE